MFDPFEYLALRHKAGLLRTDFARPLGKISYHVACHLRVQNIGLKTRDVLQLVPGTTVEPIERCSGHDGTYGVKREFRDTSMKIGKPVIQRVEASGADFYASDCPMAGHQIESGLERRAAADASADAAAHGLRTCRGNMQKLMRRGSDELGTIRAERPRLRGEVIAHKQLRNVQVGPNMTWCFEDRTTIRYQILEMLRAERIFESDGIQDELDAYNPLIPDGSNWKVTLLIEFPDPEERRVALERLIGVEDRCWVRVSEMERVFAIADEDMERENEEKTSAVHFLRFELSPSMVEAMKSGAFLSIGVDHDHYRHSLNPLPTAVRDALCRDLD